MASAISLPILKHLRSREAAAQSRMGAWVEGRRFALRREGLYAAVFSARARAVLRCSESPRTMIGWPHDGGCFFCGW
jgi:hypothetical protein